MSLEKKSGPFGNEVIEASAGSGKTYQLSNRIIRLLAHGQKPENIVALTFTRAAAGEFMAKTLEKLATAAENKTEEGKLPAEELRKALGLDASWDAARWRGLLRTTVLSMHRMTLGTLDSFFARQVVNNPTEVGLNGASISTLSDGEAQAGRNQALLALLQERSADIEALEDNLDAILMGKAPSTPIKQISEQVSDLHNLYALAKDPSTWGEACNIWPDNPPTLLLPVTDDELKEARADILKWVETAQSVPHVPPKGKSKGGYNGTAKNMLVRYAVQIPDIHEATQVEDRHESFCTGSMRAVIACEAREGIRHEYPKGYDTHYPASICEAMRRLARRVYSLRLEQKSKQTRELRKLLEDFDRVYEKALRAKGKLTFGDNVNLLLGAQDRGTSIDIEYRLDCKVRHWLFDEFQDTSTRQWKVLENNLSEVQGDGSDGEWRTTFFVGDPKQSLYGWRGGNPRLLRRERNKAHPDGDGPRLRETRRCSEPVVSMLNAVFDKVGGLKPHYLPEAACDDWQSSWESHRSLCKKAREVGETLWVQIKRTAEDAEAGQLAAAANTSSVEEAEPVAPEAKAPSEEKETDSAINQARWIGEHIRRSGMLEGRVLKHGITCAILVSKNKHAAKMTEVLRRMGIEAADEADTQVVSDNPLGAAVLALTKWAAFPNDSQSLGIIQMSKIGRAYLRKHAKDGGDLPAGQISVSDVFHAKGAEELVRHILAEFQTKDAPEGEEQSNGESFLRRRQEELIQIAVNFDESQPRDLVAFANHLENAAMRGSADRRAVQVLTIHRSKGLEYTAVYLPCLNSHDKMDKGRTDDPLMALNDDFEPQWILERPTKFLIDADPDTLGAAVNKEMADAAYENLCKLYVGMTRAIRRLVLVSDEIPASELVKSGVIKPPPGPDGKSVEVIPEQSPDLATLLHLTLNPGEPVPYTEMSGEGVPESHIMYQPIGQLAEPAASAEAWLKISVKEHQQRGGQGAEPLAAAPVIRPVRIKPSKREKAEVDHKPGAPNGRQIGITTHELLSHLEWDIDGFLKAAASGAYAVSEAQFKGDAMQLIVSCLGSVKVREALSERPEGCLLWREREAAIPDKDNEGRVGVIHAVFDRVHVVPGKSATILDYKTDFGLTDDELGARHGHQLNLYAKAIHKLAGVPPDKIRCRLVHVRLGTVVNVEVDSKDWGK